MKTAEEMLDFRTECTFSDRYSIERVVGVNHVRDCTISVLSRCDFISNDIFIRLLVVIAIADGYR